jgi:hypothetical protein
VKLVVKVIQDLAILLQNIFALNLADSFPAATTASILFVVVAPSSQRPRVSGNNRIQPHLLADNFSGQVELLEANGTPSGIK